MTGRMPLRSGCVEMTSSASLFVSAVCQRSNRFDSMYRTGTVGNLPAAEIYVNVVTPHLIPSKAARMAKNQSAPEQNKGIGGFYHHRDSFYYKSEDSPDRVSTDSPTAPAASTRTSCRHQFSLRESCSSPPITSQCSILWHSRPSSAPNTLRDGGRRRIEIAGSGAGVWGWSGRWTSRGIGVGARRGRFVRLDVSF
jgi:hypothetical protein